MRLKRQYNVNILKTTGICLSRVLSPHNFDVKNKQRILLQQHRKFINRLKDIDKHELFYYVYYIVCVSGGQKQKFVLLILRLCLSRMSYFTCNVQLLEHFSDWSRFLTRDYETPQEREDPEFRGLATWCNGIA